MASKRGAELLAEFDQDGSQALLDLIGKNRAEARAWIERNLTRVRLLAELLDPQSGSDFAHADGERKPALHKEAPNAAKDTLKNARTGLMIEYVVLQHLQGASRAVSVDLLFSVLRELDLIAPEARAALITRLNRMKEIGLLTWHRSTRAQDICLTQVGREHAEKLRDYILTKAELSYLTRLKEAKAKVVPLAKSSV